VLFVLSEYWPYVVAALVAGGVIGWWLAARQGGREDQAAPAEAE
jgi:hypothetical protein